MKLYLLDRSSSSNESITIRNNKYPNFLKIWHYHSELELVYIVKSFGTSFIGDSIEKFEEGDLYLVGKNLPHMWLNDKVYFNQATNLTAEAIAVHFKESFLGNDFLNSPEMFSIKKLLKKAQRGIKFLNVDSSLIHKLKELNEKEVFQKTIGFLELLHHLSKHTNYHLLSSQSYNLNQINTKDNNLDKVYEYIFENFNKAIDLEKVADIACMNSSSFSRYFKKVNRKTFSRYLNEIRIGFACRLILEKKYNFSRIGFESGFNNVSNFNRQFKSIKKMSPSDFYKIHNTI